MWRVVVARPEENSTLLSSDISVPTTAVPSGGHLTSLSGPPSSHHWGYPPPPHHPPYQPQHPEMRHHHHHDMRVPPPDMRVPPPDLRHPPPADMQRQDLRHDMRHDLHPRPDLVRHAEMPRHQDMVAHQEMRSHELPDLKLDGTELRTTQESQQGQQRNLKRTMSDSECDDVFSEESSKELCNSPGGDSCQHASRKRRRGMIEKKRRDRINASLGELRRLVPAAARDPHSGKLEKAEILQLTVEHLRTLRNKGPENYDSTKLAMDYHAVGWGECAAEAGRYLITMEGMDERDPLRQRLLAHLQSFHRDHSHAVAPTVPSATTLTATSTSSVASYEASANPVTSTMPPASAGSMPPLLGSGSIGWSQYPGQYPQQQHGKPYRPWGAELAY